MATTREIVTRALRRLRVVALVQEPPAEIMSHALAAFNDLLSAYERGLQTETVVITGNTQASSRRVADLDNDANLFNARAIVVGTNVSGAGIAAGTKVHKIISKEEIELDTAATASGTGVTLTFDPIPFDDSLTEALVSVLAVRMAEDFGASVGPILARDARRGQAEIDGAFMYVPTFDRVDRALVEVPSARLYDGSDGTLNNGS